MDPRTLIVCTALLSGLCALFCLFFASRNQALGIMGSLGTALLVLAAGLYALALRGLVPGVVSIVVANSLLVGSLLLISRPVRRRLGKPVRDLEGTLLLLATAAAIAYLWRSSDDTAPRTAWMAVVGAYVFGRMAWDTRGAAQPRSLPWRVFESMCWLNMMIGIVRVGTILAGPRRTDLMQPALDTTLLFILLQVTVMFGTVALLWVELSRLQEELVRTASYDHLTGALRRHAFLQACEREFSRSSRQGAPFSLILFDLDRFKSINDTMGHAAGDQALRHSVTILSRGVREHDFVGRMGGEELALLLPGTTARAAFVVAERIRQDLESEPAEFGGRRIPMTASGGIASYPEHGADLESLLQAVDSAMYAAKREGRNRVLTARPAAREAEQLATLSA